MKLLKILLPLVCFAVSLSPSSVTSARQETDKFVYADYETVQDNRPVSNRGGRVQLFGYQESAANPSRFKGAKTGDANVPELVRYNGGSNRAITLRVARCMSSRA